MRFGQIRFENKLTAALFVDGGARPVPGYTIVELIWKSQAEAIPFAELMHDLASHHEVDAPPAIPINPPEVWACGCTYEPSAAFRDGQHGASSGGIYAYVHGHERPEIFFKGTARVCVGPGQPIGIRFDSNFTAPEPELALVLGRKGAVIGFTIGNDVSAWDIERENPLYLPQSKIYMGCCALGPVIVTPDDLPNLGALTMSCTVTRDGEQRFSGSVSLGKLCRTLDYLIEYLLRANPVPPGSVLLTGTGIIVPETAALAAGDMVKIGVPEIGELANPASIVK